MKKWMALLLVLGMICLCGCGAHINKTEEVPTEAETTAPTETEAPELDVVGLSVWVMEENVWADAEQMDAVVAGFNAYYPNILVSIERHTPEDLKTSRPDVILAAVDQIGTWSAGNSIVDLSDMWANGLQGDVYPIAEGLCRTGESYHAVPLCLMPYCMAVNTQILSDADALIILNTSSHTWNTSSFFRAMEIVYDNGWETVGTIYCKDQQEDMQPRLFVENLQDGSFIEKRTGTYRVADGDMGKALASLAKQGGVFFDPGCDAQTARDAFLNGETAFVLNWNAALQAKHANRSEILYMNYPSADGIPKTYAEVYGLGIFDNGDPVQTAASVTFVEFMSNYADAIRATRNLPVRNSQKDVYNGTELETVMKDLSKMITHVKDKPAAAAHWETARTKWNEMLRSLGSAGEEYQAILDAAQQSLNSLFPEVYPPEAKVETTAE